MAIYVFIPLKIFLLAVLIRRSDGKSIISNSSGPVVTNDKCLETACPLGTNCIELREINCVGTACKPVSTCVSPCTFTICEPGQACSAIKQCRGSKCHFSANCVAVCDGVECPRDKVCRPRRVACNGPPCHPVAACVSPCEDLSCAPDQECVVDSRGKPKCRNPCSTVSCNPNEICQLDYSLIIPKPMCVENPCNRVACPNSEKCILKSDQCEIPPCQAVAICGSPQENLSRPGNFQPLILEGNHLSENDIISPNKEDCPPDVPLPPDVILQMPEVSPPTSSDGVQNDGNLYSILYSIPFSLGSSLADSSPYSTKPRECNPSLCPSKYCVPEPSPGSPGCMNRCYAGCAQCKDLYTCSAGVGGVECSLRSMCCN